MKIAKEVIFKALRKPSIGKLIKTVVLGARKIKPRDLVKNLK